MNSCEVLIIQTGVANTASVLASIRRIGAIGRLTEDPGEVKKGKRVVLPGVGTFGAAMEKLQQTGLQEVLQERIARGLPTLAVCLGLQLLCSQSEENPGIKGLGIIPHPVCRFASSVRVPQFGWNLVTPEPESEFLEKGFAYFANSYCLQEAPKGWQVAFTEYGGSFVSALERGSVLACQFHPELSGEWGLGLLRRWLEKG